MGSQCLVDRAFEILAMEFGEFNTVWSDRLSYTYISIRKKRMNVRTQITFSSRASFTAIAEKIKLPMDYGCFVK
jgi:hypothetical protein